MNYYFLVAREFDLLLSYSITLLIKESEPGCKASLIMTDHFRIKGKMSHFYNIFDEIVHVDFCWYSGHIISEGKKCFCFINKIMNLKFGKRNVFFVFGAGLLMHLLLVRGLKLFHRAENEMKTVKVLFLNEVDQGMVVNWKRSLICSLYTIPLGGLLTKWVQTADNRYDSIRQKEYFDYCLFIEQMKKRPNTVCFPNVPCPIFFVKEKVKPPPGVVVSGPSILLLMDSVAIKLDYLSRSRYWECSNRLIQKIHERNPDSTIYVKDHPAAMEDEIKKELKGNYILLDKEICAEELLVAYAHRWVATFSVCSSTSLSAGSLGIPSFVCYPYYKFNGSLMDLYDRFYSGRKNIILIKDIEDIPVLEQKSQLENSFEENLEKWQVILKEVAG